MNSLKLNNLILDALSLTSKSCMNFKHAALIIRNGKVIASGFNSDLIHAELSAITSLQRVLQGHKGKVWE